MQNLVFDRSAEWAARSIKAQVKDLDEAMLYVVTTDDICVKVSPVELDLPRFVCGYMCSGKDQLIDLLLEELDA